MSIAEQIDKDYLEAYKSRQQTRLSTLRLLKTAAKNKQVELMHPLSEDEYLSVIMHELKQRQDSIEQYAAAGRSDLADKEAAEAEVLKGYLPAPLSEEELAEVVERVVAPLLEGGMKNMGKAISAIMAEYKGRVDGKAVSAAVKARLQQARRASAACMDERTLRALEFSRVLERLSSFCLSEAGKEAALALRPMEDVAAVRESQLLYEEELSWMAEGDFALAAFPDVSGLLDYVEKRPDPIPDIDALWALKETLGQARRAAESIHAGASRRPLLDALACSLPMPELVLSALNRCISDDGALKDESSPGLLLVRGELRGIHQNCLRRVKEFAERYNIARYLQDDYMTLSSDRYVLPLKANFKGRIQGVIHDYSRTGETLYFEPLFLVEQNNRLQELKQEEREEERKVLRMIAGLMLQEMPLLRAAWTLLVQLDLGRAKCALGAALDGRCVPMQEGALLRLPGARHPLLVLESARHAKDPSYTGPRRIEPSDLLLREGDRILVISGGNAGGKTVALKTLGLVTLMTLSGLPAPVDRGATLPFWNNVRAFIGDEQSLDDHVSTFTGQIRHLSAIWEELDAHSLVLLDEFGAGTDPSQGAALAQAVLDGLLEKGAFTVTATHFPALKSYALTHEGVRAASVLFDAKTKRPLFHLAYDQVGASQALDVAREHGLPESVLRRAEHYLLMDGDDAGAVMDRLNELAKQREEELARMKDEERRLRDKRLALQEKLEKERQRLDEEVRRMSQELMHEYKSGKATAKQAQRAMAKLRVTLAPREDEEERPATDVSAFNVGSEVLHRLWNKKAVIRELDEKTGKAKIDLNGVTMWARLGDLQPGSASASPKASVTTKISRNIPLLRLDLRGKRADVALAELEQFLDRALLSGTEGVEIIHGRGTGALRKAVHEMLRAFPGVASYRTAPEDQGGDGMTQAYFR